jgi:glycosyltransferase involved in cell wall biosynthesis
MASAVRRRGLQSTAVARRYRGVPLDASEPEVAVVVPCFRYGRFLADAVESAVRQTWRNLRIVIVDDGSPDDTAAVAERLIAGHPERRIELVRQQNLGLAAARNAGVRATNSPFFLPLDADDRLHPEAIATLVAAAQRTGADVATPDGRTFGDTARRLRAKAATPRRLRRSNCLFYASLVRRELFDRIGGYRPDAPGYEDWDLWLCALEQGASFVHVPVELFAYRKHGSTMLAASDDRALRLFAVIAALHPRLFAPWRVRVAKRLLAAGDRAGLWPRICMLATFLLDRRLRLFWRQAIALRATNMLST